MHRRDIIKKLLLGTSLTIGGGGLLAFDTKPSPVSAHKVQNGPLYLFAKVLQWVPLVDLPKVVQDMGFTGIDIAVRPNGHFQVKDLTEKLPPLVASCLSLGMEPPILTTELTGGNRREMEDFLRVISAEGVKHYRMGWLKYKTDRVMDELNAFNRQFKNLEELHHKYQVQANYQNHTGSGVGGSVLELLFLLEGIDPQNIGIQYDLRHAMVEGYRSWETAFHAIKDKITTLDIKDYKWKESSGVDVPANVPLGQGNVALVMLAGSEPFKSASIPKILHVEYDLGGAEHGDRNPTVSSQEILAAIREDVEYFNQFQNN